MVVYLQPEDNISLPFNEKIVEVGQFERSFTPYISVMQLGNKVNFKNKDDIPIIYTHLLVIINFPLKSVPVNHRLKMTFSKRVKLLWDVIFTIG